MKNITVQDLLEQSWIYQVERPIDNENYYQATIAEIKNVVGTGTTSQEAITNLKESLVAWFENALTHNVEIPKPFLSKVTEAKFIKLGAGGSWEAECLKEGTLRIGFREASLLHREAIAQDKEALTNFYLKQDKEPKKAKDFARQITDFYRAGQETLWITFHAGTMWWCQTGNLEEYPVLFVDEEQAGDKYRKTLYGWKNYTQNDPSNILIIEILNGKLTKTAGYRSTICQIKPEPFEYLIRKIQGKDTENAKNIKECRNELKNKLINNITDLQPKDFELFIDLIFIKAGWNLLSPSGGQKKGIDATYLNPLTNERIIVQAKCQTNQKELDEYISVLENYKSDKAYLIYHSTDKKSKLDSKNSTLELMDAEKLADQAIRLGLVDWLILKAD